MDTNTMIVWVVEALLCFAILCLVVLRLDRLGVRLRDIELDVSGWVMASMRFFKEEPPKSLSPPKAMRLHEPLRVLLGDQREIDWMLITHPDHDHWDVLRAGHHGRR
jgi:hypothetical protein